MKKGKTVERKKAIRKILKVVGPNHLYRRFDDKPTLPELQILKKAVYHALKMSFEPDPGGTSLTIDGKPVKAKVNGFELTDLLNKIVNSYGTI